MNYMGLVAGVAILCSVATFSPMPGYDPVTVRSKCEKCDDLDVIEVFSGWAVS